MSEHQVNNLLGVTMEKIKQMVDVDTVMGSPVTAPDGTVIIPVSKVSYGFAGGGTDLPTKQQQQAANGLFLGGSGAAITVNPIAFLTVREGSVRVLQIEPYFSSVDRAIEKIPDVVDQLSAIVEKFKGNKDDKKAEKSLAEEKPAQ